MKKLVSLALAAALTLSSIAAFAAPNGYGVEPVAEVPVSLDTQIGKTDSSVASYDDKALTIKTASGSAVIEAKATIDMTDFAKAWAEYVAKGAEAVAETLGVEADVARASVLEFAELTGEFKIVVTVDKEIKRDYVRDAIVWSENVTDLFSEKGMEFESGDDKNTLTVIMEIAEDTTNEELDAYFMGILAEPKTSDEVMSLTLGNTAVTGDYGVEYEIKTQFVGGVTIATPSEEEMKVTFDETDTNYVKLAKWSISGGGGAGSVPTAKPTAKPTEAPTEAPTGVPTEAPTGVPTGEPTEAPTGEPTEAPTGEPTEAPTGEPTATPEPQTGGTSSGATLEYDNHFAYIIGYDAETDGSIEVRPEHNITRAEVATIFYRLLDEESRAKFLTKDSIFSDVADGDWFNNAVATVAAAGIVEGYDDGTFGPDRPITRAEFATIASRFSSLTHDGEAMFSDIVGHWAEDYIDCAAVTGWVNGYDDGTFRPERAITRAEAITLINRVLYRIVHEDGHLDDGHIDFTDNDTSAWYYSAIVEASNSHDYDREAIGHPEVHTALTENIDWDSHQ